VSFEKSTDMNASNLENIYVRDYRSSDYPEIMEVWSATGLGGRGRGDDQQIIEDSLALGGRLLVAEDIQKKQLVGTSWMTFDGRRIHLHHIGVLDDYTNKGIGKLLTRESLRFAREKGYQIKLEVRDDNARAIHIYKKLGFERLGDYDIYIVRDVSKINV
jgi:ribosomal protein S18 acetylase RimI-like enzyme